MEEHWVPVIHIAALRSAISAEKPMNLHENTGNFIHEKVFMPLFESFTVSLEQLGRKAEQTLWEKLPLRAIAEAHEREAERIMALGHPDDSASNNAAVYVEYCKYLKLYPDRDSPEYDKIAKRVCLLEQLFDGKTAEQSSFTNIPSAAPSPSESRRMKWKFFILGVVAATVVPFVVGRVGKQK
ncbi:hypothetical protein C8R45DRAFT_1104112 [Mycena sanguinolenta]|nr:hypothetical protein C8R45DRAFT_1104112 [Mycena sanguinolenta]